MSNPAHPERLRSLLEASLALGDSPSMRQLREAMTSPSAGVSRIATLAGQGERQRQSWNRFLAEAVRSQDESRRLLRNTAMQQWGNAAAMRLLQSAAPARRSLTADEVLQVLRDMDAWRGMPPAQQLATFSAVDETYESAASRDEEVPDELVDEFEDTARTFLSSDVGLLPPKMQRTLFVYFCGLIVLVALMQASFTSDAVDAVLGKAADYAPFAGAAMLAAGKAFDRYTGNQNDEDEEDTGS